MDFASILSILVPVAVCCLLIVTANQDEKQQTPFARSRWLMYGVTAGLFGFALTLLPYVLLSSEQLMTTSLPVTSDKAGTLLAFTLCMIGAALSLIFIGAPQSRQLIMRWSGDQAHFNPWSSVHVAAIILSLALLATNLAQLILSGGVEGLAQQFDEESSTFISSVLLQQALWIFPSFLGVGLLVRRNLRASVERLGLRRPTADDILTGIGVAIAMLIFVFALSFVWTLVTAPETLAEQTAASAEISEAVNTLPLALLVSIAVAFGEEIFFRGALQPIFGIGLTSVFFMLLHTQYTLTPASIAILVLSVSLGWLRKRHSTTAAIIAHLLYNFAQLALAIFASSFVGGI